MNLYHIYTIDIFRPSFISYTPMWFLRILLSETDEGAGFDPTRYKRARLEFLHWISEQGFDHHFTVFETKVPGLLPESEPVDRMVAMMSVPSDDAALAIRLRFGCLPLPSDIAIPGDIDPTRPCWLEDA